MPITSPNGGEVLQGGVTTVTWTGRDDIGDDLTYDRLYSADGGVTWRSLINGLHEQEADEQEFDVDLSRIPGSNQALFRVIASDGVLTATVTDGRTAATSVTIRVVDDEPTVLD